jgi:hypothetical protein
MPLLTVVRSRWQRVIHPRRAMTLILVAICITMLFGIAALAIDFARMYAFVAQLRVLTDATAMSAITDLKYGGVNQTTAAERALALRAANRVNSLVLSDSGMNSADIEPGAWSTTTQAFTPSSWSTASAIRTTARYDAPWSLARFFGTSVTRRLTQVSVASLGSVSQSRCLKPWAVPYTNMLVTLGHQATDTTYRLTAADVTTLRDNRISIAFKVSSSTTDAGGAVIGTNTISGNFYGVQYPPAQYANGTAGNPVGGASIYRAAIADNACTSASGTAAVGDWLDLENGDMAGPTKQGMSDFCGQSGTKFPCDRDVMLPIWNGRSSGAGSAWVKILYLGAFHLTSYDNGTVTGYLKILAAVPGSGGGMPTPGPILTGMLVK